MSSARPGFELCDGLGVEAALADGNNNLCSVVDTELAHDFADMKLYGRFRHVEFAADGALSRGASSAAGPFLTGSLAGNRQCPLKTRTLKGSTNVWSRRIRAWTSPNASTT
jgi:hypothetical protein